MKPEFANIKNWVFDLDETLYLPKCGLLGQLKRRVRENLAVQWGLSYDETNQICEGYNQKYGSVFQGLIKHHQVDMNRFVDDVYDFDLSVLTSCLKTKKLIQKLPGKKYIFTTSPALYACNVLEKLDILYLFERVFDVTNLSYQTKPNPVVYNKVFSNIGGDSQAAIFIEDQHKNLLPAHKMGIKTVLVNRPDEPQQPYTDYQYPTLLDFLQDILDE